MSLVTHVKFFPNGLEIKQGNVFKLANVTCFQGSLENYLWRHSKRKL